MPDLLGGNFGAAGGGLAPMPGGAGGPLGLPPARRRKRGSNKNVFFLLMFGGGVMMFLLCGGVAMYAVPYGIRAARRAAAEAKLRDLARRIERQSLARDSMPRGSSFPRRAPPSSFAARSNTSSSAWRPNPQYAAQLPTRVSFDRYSMQLPQGFTFRPVQQDLSRLLAKGLSKQAYSWTGPSTFEGPSGVVAVGVITATNGQRLTPDNLPSLMSTALNKARIEGRMNFFHSEPSERGQIMGKEAIRARFDGTAMTKRLEGMVCLIVDSSERLIEIYCMRPLSVVDPSRELLEASLLTLQ